MSTYHPWRNGSRWLASAREASWVFVRRYPQSKSCKRDRNMSWASSWTTKVPDLKSWASFVARCTTLNDILVGCFTHGNLLCIIITGWCVKSSTVTVLYLSRLTIVKFFGFYYDKASVHVLRCHPINSSIICFQHEQQKCNFMLQPFPTETIGKLPKFSRISSTYIITINQSGLLSPTRARHSHPATSSVRVTRCAVLSASFE